MFIQIVFQPWSALKTTNLMSCVAMNEAGIVWSGNTDHAQVSGNTGTFSFSFPSYSSSSSSSSS